MPPLDRLERLTDLVLVLLHANRPMTLEEIAAEVPGYPEGLDARRQAFERDKRLLREEGIPVLTEQIGGAEQYGYRIDAESLYLADLELDSDERAALNLAVAAVDVGDPSGRAALLKLGASGMAEVPPLASLRSPKWLAPLFDALRTRAMVTFPYRGDSRIVAPGGLRFRDGWWYLVGWDQERNDARRFRVDRIEGAVEAGPPGSGVPPEGFDPVASAPDRPVSAAGEGRREVTVTVDAIEAGRVAAEVGESAVVARGDDGSVTLRLGVTDEDVLRTWILGLLDHVEITGPSDLRSALIAWLESIAAVPPGSVPAPGEDAATEETNHRSAVASLSGPPQKGPPAKDARQRLRILLAMIGWLATVKVARIDELAKRFSIDEDDVVAELELAACCGLPPYTPDVLMEIVVTEDSVEARLSEDLARPRQLTASEGWALAAAARAILAVPGADGTGALASALRKLEAVLGASGGVEVEIDAPIFLDDVRTAVSDQSSLQITYHSASTDETTNRHVDPLALISLDGHWYLDAYCHRAEGLRRFRVDRISTLTPLEGVHAPDSFPLPPSPEAFVPGPGATEVRLALSPAAHWVAEAVPTLRVTGPVEADALGSDSGTMVITLAVGGLAWLERLLLQAGPEAQVLSPPDLIGIGRDAARRLLVRYGSSKD